MIATVLKRSESGKSIFVRVMLNKYDTKGIAGYCANPDDLKAEDIIKDFPEVSGIENRSNADGELMMTKPKDGSAPQPLSFIVFA